MASEKKKQMEVIKEDGVQIMMPKRPRNVEPPPPGNEVQHETFAEPQIQQPEPKPDSDQQRFKPTTSVMLQGQQRLIDDMKHNFEKEMASVKEQMLRQQQLF